MLRLRLNLRRRRTRRQGVVRGLILQRLTVAGTLRRSSRLLLAGLLLVRRGSRSARRLVLWPVLKPEAVMDHIEVLLGQIGFEQRAVIGVIDLDGDAVDGIQI